MNNKKVVITGASGFLGRHLLQCLNNDCQYTVYALSSRPGALKEQYGGSNIVYLYKDIVFSEAEVLKEGFVINCAYPRNAVGSEIAEGIKYIQTVFEASVAHGARAIINISSQSVYSQARTEIADENTALSLESAYAVGKYAIELMLENNCKDTATAYTNLRLASLIGPDFNQRIVNRFVFKLLHDEAISVSKQEKRLGFLDVEDAVSAILAVLNTERELWKPVYTVGSGVGYTVEELYNAAVDILRHQKTIREPIFEYGSDCSTTAVSFSLLHEDTGFTPQIPLSKSIENIIKYME